MSKTKETLSAAAIEARKQYKRDWNAKNRDKLKQYQKRYWERKAADTTSSKAVKQCD